MPKFACCYKTPKENINYYGLLCDSCREKVRKLTMEKR